MHHLYYKHTIQSWEVAIFWSLILGQTRSNFAISFVFYGNAPYMCLFSHDYEFKNNASASFFCHCECSEAISFQVGDCDLPRNDSKKLILSDSVRTTLFAPLRLIVIRPYQFFMNLDNMPRTRRIPCFCSR